MRLGLVESLGRPRGNVTGVTSLSTELIAKRVELLRHLLPKVSRVAVLWDDETPNSRLSLQELETAGRPLGIGTGPGREYAEAGGLLSYAVRYPDLFRRAASYVDKILKGAHASDLPVEQPTTFELVSNLKTARALGLTIRQPLLQRADQLIE